LKTPDKLKGDLSAVLFIPSPNWLIAKLGGELDLVMLALVMMIIQ
jgi:hypothetical protein